MADNIVTEDSSNPGVFKVKGPALTSSNKITLVSLDTTGASSGDVITLQAGGWGPASAPPSADTASNVGGGTGTIFKQKLVNDFQFKTLIAGTGITITNGVSDITLALTSVANQPVVIVQDQKAQNTGGGTFTSGAWRTRDINTEVADSGGNCTIAANQITLQPGTYHFEIFCPGYEVNGHQARLFNITDTTEVQRGTSCYAGTGLQLNIFSIIQGRMTIASAKVFEIQHQCETTNATIGLGRQGNVAGEIYTTALFTKES